MAERAGLPTREQVIHQLIALDRRARSPVRSKDLPWKLRRSIAATFGGLKEARRAAQIQAPSLARKWSLVRMLEEMRELSRQGVSISARCLIECGHRDVMQAAYRYAGSLRRARMLAGVPHPVIEPREKEPWDEDRVVFEILRLHERGKSIAYSKVEARLVAAAARYFGTYESAVEAAGFDYSTIRLRREDYDREEILDLLRNLARRKPHMPLAELHSVRGAPTAIRMFGSIERAARAAGIRGWPRRQMFPLAPRARVLERLRARRRAGKPVFGASVARADHNLWSSALTHFSTWTNALAAAELRNDSPRNRKWSRSLVIERMRERQERGLSLRPSDVQRSDGSLYATAVRLFGSYRVAAKRLGVDTSKRHWTKAMVIRELRRAAGRKRRLLARHAPPSLVVAAQTLFGAFSTACGAAGLEVHTKRKWNRTEVLRELRTLLRAGKLTKAKMACGFRKF